VPGKQFQLNTLVFNIQVWVNLVAIGCTVFFSLWDCISNECVLVSCIMSKQVNVFRFPLKHDTARTILGDVWLSLPINITVAHVQVLKCFLCPYTCSGFILQSNLLPSNQAQTSTIQSMCFMVDCRHMVGFWIHVTSSWISSTNLIVQWCVLLHDDAPLWRTSLYSLCLRRQVNGMSQRCIY